MQHKRKDFSPTPSAPSAKRQELCVVHASGIKQGPFTCFKDTKDPDGRLKVLHNIRDRRLAEPVTSPHRMSDVCRGIPDQLTDKHKQGYHRGCYQRFTSNLNRLSKHGEDDPSTSNVSTNRPKRKESGEHIIFQPDCVFCSKRGRIHVTKSGTNTTEGTASFEKDGWQHVLQIAEQNDHEWLLRRIRGYDLFACEAKYHPKCRRQYIVNPEHWRSGNPDATAEQSALEAAHESSFRHVAKYIDETLLQGRQVATLSSLRLMYIAKLDETRFANPNFRADRLKRKLEKHPVLGTKLTFTKVQPKSNSWPFYLVYSSSISVDEAVTQAYQLASRDAIKDAALLLRSVIQRSYEESKELPWPPPASALEVTDDVIPSPLKRFLSTVISVAPTAASDRTERIIFSIGQDICRAVTNGEWKLPKHILLSMTLRHLYRSKQLVTLLNRLGHCDNYLFSVELETAMAEALERTSSLLTPRIVKSPENIVFHSEWDNFNQLLTGLHGRPAFNTAAGIMLQEAEKSEEAATQPNLPSIPRTRERTLKLGTPAPLQPFHITKRKGPDMELSNVHQSQENMASLLQGLKVYLIWALSRKASSTDKQRVPAFGGFISATGFPPRDLTTIEFYPSITEPITQDNVVKELLRQCQKATEEVGQQYTITTFDLGVVMKAMPIIWNRPADYKNHIILIGTFHTIMNYLNMLGHKMAGSGYSEIIIEANLTTSGCLKGVLNGKAYSKSLWCLKVVSEAVERLLLAAYIAQRDESRHSSQNSDVMDAVITSCNAVHLAAALQDDTIDEYLVDYMAFQERVRNGELGKTGTFWLSFLDHARRVFMLLYAVKTNNFKLYHKCMGEMAYLFFAFGGMNYARYLTWFDVFLTNIEVSHPGATQLLENGAISVARSQIPGNRCAVDKTMEETFMRFAKSHCGAGGAGLTGILENYGAYQRWIRTTSERTKYYQATLEMTGMNNDTDGSKCGKHREQLASEVKRSEAAVQRAMDAIQGFLNPFEVAERDRLYIISSGNPVPPDIEHDVMIAEDKGRSERDRFVKERLQEHEEEDEGKDFFDRVQKLKLKSMERVNKKVKLTTTQGNVIKYQEQGDVAFQILVKSQLLSQPVDIDELMTYPITPVPHCLGTPDGFMAKTNKAAAVHYLTSDISDAEQPSASPGETLYIEDGNAHFHILKDIPPTFKDICLKLLDLLSHKPDVIFSTDMYVEDSIKSQERLRRGSSDKIILEGIHTRKPADFKVFLQNDENKRQLCKFMLRIWSCPEAARRLEGRKVVLVVEGVSFQLSSSDGQSVQQQEIPGLRSNQEETDSRVILYLLYAKEHGYKQAIVHSPDSDIFFIMLHYAQKLRPLTILFDTGAGKNRRLFNISDIAEDLGPRYSQSLLGIYCFTGEDCNCAFKGKGKKTPMKKLEKKPRYQESFAKLGDSWEMDEELVCELEEFVCFLYGFPRVKEVNTVRALMLKKMVGEGAVIKSTSKVDLARIPPCRQSLIPHIKRANYRAAQWKRADVPFQEMPVPTEHGWTRCGDFIEPVWSEGPILPPRLEDIVAAVTEVTSDDEDSDGDGDDVEESECSGLDDYDSD